MYSLNNISFYRENEKILENLSINIKKNDKIILSGNNGIGKTTLLKLLAGVYFVNRGEIIFQDKILNKQIFKDINFRKSFRLNVALLFQNIDAMLFNPTVYDEIAFTPRQLGIENVDLLIKNIAKTFEIEDLLHKTPFKLSGGQKQKVALACVLVHSPKVLLLDEPSCNLDAKSVLALANIINELQETTVIVVSHDNEFNSLLNAKLIDFEALSKPS